MEDFQSENENWECFLCGAEDDFEILPTGYLSNYHPLCENCADLVLNDKSHPHRFRLSYHLSIGELAIIANVPFPKSYFKMN